MRVGLPTLAFSLVMLFVMACSERERLNPLDPANPMTGGALTGFNVRAIKDSAYLDWRAMEVEDLVHYELQRSVDDSAYQSLADVAAGNRTYLDQPLIYDRHYRYRARAVTDYSTSAWSDTISLVAGPFNFWISDYYDFRVYRMSYDVNHLLDVGIFTTPTAIVTAPDSNSFYIAEYWNRLLRHIDRDMRSLEIIELAGQPLDLAMDPDLNRVNVLLSNNQLERVQLSNNNRTLIPLPMEVSTDARIAYDRVHSNLWVAGGYVDSVLRIDLNTLPASVQVFGDIPDPRRVVTDPRLGGCWVATDSGLVKFRNEDILMVRHPELTILDMSINTINSDIYFTGYYHESPTEWTTGRISENDFTDEVLLGSEYPRFYRIIAIPGPGKHGFMAMQLDTWRLLRFDARQELIGEYPMYSGALDITLE